MAEAVTVTVEVAEVAAAGGGAGSSTGTEAGTEAGTGTGKPKFRAYPSLQPSRSAATVAAGLLKIAAHAGVATPEAVFAVATPKIHGSNVQLYYAPTTGVKYGRRSAFLSPGEEHYGAAGAGAALELDTKLPALFSGLAMSHPTLTAVAVYGEVYGGWYPHPDVPAAKPSRKPVQKWLWYAPAVQLVAFDVQLLLADGTARFMDFEDARFACRYVDIPFIPPAKRGPLQEVCEWAVAHAADNALAYYNPLGLPLLERNAGEGFVVRLVSEAVAGDDRALAKVKNPAFSEVAEGGDEKKEKAAADVDPAEAAGAAVALKYLNEHRAAAVTSKMAAADVTPRNIKALAEALIVDAKAEPVIEPAELAAVADGKGAKAFTARAFSVMRAFLMSH